MYIGLVLVKYLPIIYYTYKPVYWKQFKEKTKICQNPTEVYSYHIMTNYRNKTKLIKI